MDNNTICRKKLYKSGKVWVVGALFAFGAVGGVSMGTMHTVSADTIASSVNTNAGSQADVNTAEVTTYKDKATEVPTTDVKPAEVTTDKDKATEVPATDAKPAEVTIDNDKASEVPATDAKPAEVTIDNDKASDVPATDAKPAEVTTDKDKTSDVPATDAKPAEVTTDKDKTSDVPATDAKPAEVTTDKDKTSDVPATDAKPAEVTTDKDKTSDVPATDDESDDDTEDEDEATDVSETDDETADVTTDKDKATDVPATDVKPAEVTTDKDKATDVPATVDPFKDVNVVEGSYQERDGAFKFIDSDGNVTKGLVKANGALRYFDENGNQVKGQYFTIDGKTYYANVRDGVIATQAVKINNQLVGFADDGSLVKNGFAKDSQGSTYYFDEQGSFVTGLKEIDGATYYFDEDGHLRKGFSGVFNGKVLSFDDKTGKLNEDKPSTIKEGISSLNTDYSAHNAAYDTTSNSFENIDGYLTAKSWYRPAEILDNGLTWRASSQSDYRPILMSWYPSKATQVAYLNYMASQGFITSAKKFTNADDQSLLNQASNAVQKAIEQKIAAVQSVTWLKTTMDQFISEQDQWNKTSETEGTDHLQGGALSFVNSELTPDSNSNFRLMNRTPTSQTGTQAYKEDNSKGGFELLLANDVDNSNPIVQAEQLNWLYYLMNFGSITNHDSDANFDGIRIDAVDNVDADLLQIAANYFKLAYGTSSSDKNANSHISILEDWSHNDPIYMNEHGNHQLTMDDYAHTQMIFSLTKSPKVRATMQRFIEYYMVDRRQNSTQNTAIPNYSFLRAHDSEVQTVIGDIIKALHPDVANSLVPTQEQMAEAFKVYNKDMRSVNKKFTQYNVPAAYAMLLTNKDTVPRVYYGDMYTDDGQYMAKKSPYFNAISTLLQARTKYVAGGQSMAVDSHDIMTSVRYGKGAMTVSDKGTAETRNQGIGVVISNNESLRLAKNETVTLHMGAAHKNQTYRAVVLTTKNGLSTYVSDKNAPVKKTDENGDLILTNKDIRGYKNVQVSGYLSAWVPVGADDNQDARTVSSDETRTDGQGFRSNASLDSQLIYEGFSNFQAEATTHDEFTNVQIAKNADLFKSWGVTSFQLAPQYRSSTDKTFLDSIIHNGYAFTDRYDLGFGSATKYGDVDDLRATIKALHANGIQAIADFVPDQIYNLPGQEVITATRTDSLGNVNQDSELNKVLYVSNSKGGGEYQKMYGGEFLETLKSLYPSLFTDKQISTGEAINGNVKIKEWSAKYFNGSDIQGKGAAFVLKDDATNDYFKVTSNSSDKNFLPKQLMNQTAVTGFTSDEKGTKYFSTSGYQAKNSVITADDGNKYYFDADGYMATGLQHVNGDVYFFLPNGAAVKKAFVQGVDGQSYYFSSTGRAVKNAYITDDSGATYRFQDDGVMLRNTKANVEGHDQYFTLSGAQLKGASVTDDMGIHFYADGSGDLVRQSFVENSDETWSYFDEDGNQVKGSEVVVKDKTLLFDENGIQVKGQFKSDNGQTKYYDGSTGALKQGEFFEVKGDWYYADDSGIVLKGLQKANGHVYLFDQTSGQILRNQYVELKPAVFGYIGAEGYLVTGLNHTDGIDKFFHEDGSQSKGEFITANGISFYTTSDNGDLVKDGYVPTENGDVYLVNGQLASGFVQTAQGNQYFEQGVTVQNKLVTVDNQHYYVDASGAIQKDGFVHYENKTYYLTDGAFAKGLVTVDGQTHYFDKDGVAVSDQLVNVDRKHSVYVNKQGIVVKNGFYNYNGKTYFANEKGYSSTGFITKGDGFVYYATRQGIVVMNKFVTIRGSRYHFDEQGVMSTGFVEINGRMNYFNAHGRQLKNGYRDQSINDGNGVSSRTYHFKNYVGTEVKAHHNVKSILSAILSPSQLEFIMSVFDNMF